MLLFDIGFLGLLVSASATAAKRQVAGPPPGLPDPSTFPPECGTSCAVIIKTLVTCANLKCYCTSANIAATAECLQCAVDVGGAVATYQKAMNQAEQSCTQNGFAVPAETLSAAPAFTSTQASPPVAPPASTPSVPSPTPSPPTPTPSPVPVPSPSPSSESSDLTQPTDASTTDGGVASVPSLSLAGKLYSWNISALFYLPMLLSLLSGLVIGTTQII